MAPAALRLNVHLHTLALDGVYVKTDDGGLRFLRLSRPSEDEVYDVAFRTAKKVVAMLEKKEAAQTLGVAASAYLRNRRKRMPCVCRGNEMARGGADGGGDPAGIGASGAICARAASAKKGATRAALVTVSEDASDLKERCILREVALVYTGADARVCPRVMENRTQETSMATKRASLDARESPTLNG